MDALGGGDRVPAPRGPRIQAETVSAENESPHGEIYRDGSNLVGTFFLPEHEPHEVRYHVGRRTITIWSRKPQRQFQTILVLPQWVRPETYVLSHKNGLYEFTMQALDEPPASRFPL